jgi:two-component system heavy metal sensor histidine kinase CusS
MSLKSDRRSQNRWSLATWLTVWYSALSITLIACVTAYSYWVLISNLNHEDDEFVATYLKDVEASLLEDPNELDELRSSWSKVPTEPSLIRILMRVLRADGTILAETHGNEEVPWPTTDFRGAVETKGAGGVWRCLSQEGVLALGDVVILQAALDRRQESIVLARYRKQLYLVLFVASVACAAGGVLLARQGLRPLLELSSVAAGIQANQMQDRLDSSKYAVELEQVATTFNGMLDRLQFSFERLHRFSGDIAHELRTPLHNLRGEVEVALTKTRCVDEYRDVLGSCLEETIRLSRLVDSLLFLARSEQPQSALNREPLRLVDELTTIQEFFEAAAEDASVSLSVLSPSNLEIAVDRTLFQRAIGNLVTNAFAHTPANGHVEIRGENNGTSIKVTVTDTGNGIAPDHLPHVFDRLYRGDESRRTSIGGHGLGLAIVKSIIELHEGQVSIRSEIGKGTCVETVWPQVPLTSV